MYLYLYLSIYLSLSLYIYTYIYIYIYIYTYIYTPNHLNFQSQQCLIIYICIVWAPQAAWTAVEDAALIQLVAKHGRKWVTIAESIPGRDGPCCMHHWPVIGLAVIKKDQAKRRVDAQLDLSNLSTLESAAWARLQVLHGEDELYSLAASAMTDSTSGFHGVQRQACRFRYYVDGVSHSAATALGAALELSLVKVRGVSSELQGFESVTQPVTSRIGRAVREPFRFNL